MCKITLCFFSSARMFAIATIRVQPACLCLLFQFEQGVSICCDLLVHALQSRDNVCECGSLVRLILPTRGDEMSEGGRQCCAARTRAHRRQRKMLTAKSHGSVDGRRIATTHNHTHNKGTETHIISRRSSRVAAMLLLLHCSSEREFELTQPMEFVWWLVPSR